MYRCYAYTETHICMHFMYFAFSHESVPHRILSCHLHIFSLYSIFNVHPLLQKTDALPLASSLLVGRRGGLHYGRREEVTSDRGSHVVLHAALTEHWQKDSKWLSSEEPQGVFNLDTQSVSRVFFRQQLSKWWGVWSPWPYHGLSLWTHTARVFDFWELATFLELRHGFLLPFVKTKANKAELNLHLHKETTSKLGPQEASELLKTEINVLFLFQVFKKMMLLKNN